MFEGTLTTVTVAAVTSADRTDRPASADLSAAARSGGPDLTVALVDMFSVSGTETALADAVEALLRPVAHLRVDRVGDAVVARTDLGRAERVVVAGHLDTVPEAGNLPCRRADGIIHGLGSCDMKGGVAVALRLALSLDEPVRDLTFVLYDGEEVEESRNGLKRVAERHPDWLAADFAVLMEPTGADVEAGCQGTLRAEVLVVGTRAHSARSWLGLNAIHEAGDVLGRLRAYQPRVVDIDGLQYREGLNAVHVSGGVAGNVVPDLCTVTVNYRFAPDRSLEQAQAHVREVFEGFEVRLTDGAPGALPGLDRPAAAAFVSVIGKPVRPKFGWTDVARFTALGVPAVNYGPGDPQLAHRADECVPESEIVECEQRMREWLTA
jgi:succinyl-diaminopimelate desuccinylase